MSAGETGPGPDGAWMLRLYIAGATPKSARALANLRRICDRHLAGRYEITVVDLVQAPHLASADQIVAIPTLVRCRPEPVRKIIGDLSDTDKVLIGLEIRSPDDVGAS